MTGVDAASRAGRVLVTGASRGIGRAVALELASAGYDLTLWARDAARLAEVARLAREAGAAVGTDVVDVADAAAVARAAAALSAEVPALRGLVLNAGSGRWTALDATSPDQWRDVVGTNLDGAFFSLRSVVPLLRAHPAAQVVGLASDSSFAAIPGRAAYCASKAGFVALLETARAELRADGVRVTVVAPSRVDTHFGGRAPGDRPGSLTPEHLAGVVRFVLDLPHEVELRELQLSALTTTYGRLPEHAGVTQAGRPPADVPRPVTRPQEEP